MSRHLSIRNISSQSMYVFLSNLANRQTKERGQTHLPPPLSEVITVCLYQALSALSVYNKYTDRFDKRHVTAKVVEPEVKLSLSFNRRVFHADDDDVDTVRVADELVVHQQVWLVAGKLPETQISSTFTSAAHAIHLYWVSTDRTQTDHDQHCFLFHCILYLFIHRIAVSVTYFIIICFLLFLFDIYDDDCILQTSALFCSRSDAIRSVWTGFENHLL